MKMSRIWGGFFFIFLSVELLFGQTVEENKSPIKLKVDSEITGKCAEKVFTLKVSLFNTSNEDVLIDTKGIGDLISFSTIRMKLGKATSSNMTLINDNGGDHTSNYIILKLGETYETKLKISLYDEFFIEPGKYRLRVAYRQYQNVSYENKKPWIGSVYSDPISLYLQPCE